MSEPHRQRRSRGTGECDTEAYDETDPEIRPWVVGKSWSDTGDDNADAAQ